MTALSGKQGLAREMRDDRFVRGEVPRREVIGLARLVVQPRVRLASVAQVGRVLGVDDVVHPTVVSPVEVRRGDHRGRLRAKLLHQAQLVERFLRYPDGGMFPCALEGPEKEQLVLGYWTAKV